jgi:L-rhamnose isomerase / sugar isomerase
MRIDQYKIDQHNDSLLSRHNNQFIFLKEQLGEQGIDANKIVGALEAFQVAIPSWALGTGGTRFGRFSGGGEPRSLEEKIEDVGLLHALNRSSGSISLHIPWDIPSNAADIIALAASHNLKFDAVNSNTFQDQKDQELSYKFGSLSHVDPKVHVFQVSPILLSHSRIRWNLCRKYMLLCQTTGRFSWSTKRMSLISIPL